MAPNTAEAPTGALWEHDDVALGLRKVPAPASTPSSDPANTSGQIIWTRVAFLGYFHLTGLYGLVLAFTSAKLATTAFTFFLYLAALLGTTAGGHRLWSHRAYKATAPLRVLLVLLQTLANSWSVIDWARDHRVHHKYVETDADPHNSTRGFFFAHIGCVLLRKHPDVTRKGKAIDLSDLQSDPILAFQKKYYVTLSAVFGFVVPIMIPVYLWDESLLAAWALPVALRQVLVWNVQFLINSLAHIRGNRPYERSMAARDNLAASLVTMGEGWHNYHHAFPWDYKAAELGNYGANLTTAFIDLMARVGWAYDLKTVPAAMVEARVRRTGDGSHEVWGWGDRDMADEDYGMASVRSRRTWRTPSA